MNVSEPNIRASSDFYCYAVKRIFRFDDTSHSLRLGSLARSVSVPEVSISLSYRPQH